MSCQQGLPKELMSNIEIIESALQKLVNYIESQNYLGYDPYDALKSALFKLPLFKSNKILRFGFQQSAKRFPINVRPLLLVPKGYNPVTLGLCIQGYANIMRGAEYGVQSTNHNSPQLSVLSPQPKKAYLEKIDFLIKELKSLIPTGYHGACWGYDFPWEARYASIPAYQPNIVATGIITNALFIAYKITGNRECAELIKSSTHFVLNDLNRTYEGENLIFSYSPFDHQQVFNASMKAVRLLAQAYSLTGDEYFKTAASRAGTFVASKQQNNGSWDYSLTNGGNWTDNYHTGYVLECLIEFALLCKDNQFDNNLKSGYKFYWDHFVEENGMPKFYSNDSWPADCTAAAQTILTLVRFGDKEKALKVAEWTVKNMQSPDGGFYFRKYKHHTEKTIFMRWSNAWMFAALSKLSTIKEIK